MSIWFVTRHSGAIDWAEEEGFHIDSMLTHLDISQVKKGDTVIGSLPVNLAADVCALGARYFHLSVDLPEKLRGVELTKDIMRSCNARLEEYKIERVI